MKRKEINSPEAERLDVAVSRLWRPGQGRYLGPLHAAKVW